ncbi:MAG: glycoside hydrolase family 99-like domain-containing protein [Candidatus Sulfotelmatobacter sp.]
MQAPWPGLIRRTRGVLGILVAALVLQCVFAAASQGHLFGITRQVLAFYYGWYGIPSLEGHWVHWNGVDEAAHRTSNTTGYPAVGPYDSHDPSTVAHQVEMAKVAGITGFIASWWGPGSFEDRGIPLLIAAAARRGLVVSAILEEIPGDDHVRKMQSAVQEIDYLLARYAGESAWLRAGGKPVIYVYGRALHALLPDEWREAISAVRRDNPGGVMLIADEFKPEYASVFDGASNYNVTTSTYNKGPTQLRIWAHNTYPLMVESAGPGKISTLTVIPGFDDSELGRPPPRPITRRRGGETYRILWREAIAAQPDYILITSWNEWHEGTEIEPSVEYGTTYLSVTATLAHQFLMGGQ